MKELKCVLPINSLSDFDFLLELPLELSETIEILVGTRELSRFFTTSVDDLLKIKAKAIIKKIPLVLVWDIISTEEKFCEATLIFERLPLFDFKAVRVQDPGALHYLKTRHPWVKIQLILENGNHNLEGLKKWKDYLGDQGDRLILSNELSRDLLKEYSLKLAMDLEILVFGPILLFYSPRMLLSPFSPENTENLQVIGHSEESPHSGFPLIENKHGTFMFNVKDLFLLDHLEEILGLGLFYVRVDLFLGDDFKKYLERILNLFFTKRSSLERENLKEDFKENFKDVHQRPWIKGFYQTNKSDVLFSKLKNKRIQRNDENYIGEIVDVERDIQLALIVKSRDFIFTSLNELSEVKMITPEGKEKIVKLHWIKTLNDLVLIPYIRGITVKTQVYKVT